MTHDQKSTGRERPQAQDDAADVVGAWRGGRTTLLSLIGSFVGLTLLASLLTEFGSGPAGVVVMGLGLVVVWLVLLFVARHTASD